MLKNMMTDEQITQLVFDEIEQQNWGVTQQILEIHDVVRVDGRPSVAWIEWEESSANVYIAIENQKFFLMAMVDTIAPGKIIAIDTEGFYELALVVWSEALTYEEMAGMTSFVPTMGWCKGDRQGNRGDVRRKETLIRYVPHPQPDSFENKLDKLLDYLEMDVPGVKRLTVEANAIIMTYSAVHNANRMLGGPRLENEHIKRIAALNLGIDFDVWAGENTYGSPPGESNQVLHVDEFFESRTAGQEKQEDGF